MSKKASLIFSIGTLALIGTSIATPVCLTQTTNKASTKLSSVTSEYSSKDIVDLQSGDIVTGFGMGINYENMDPTQAWAGYDNFDLHVNFADTVDGECILVFSHLWTDDYSAVHDEIQFYCADGNVEWKQIYYDGQWTGSYDYSVEHFTDGNASEWTYLGANYTDGTPGFGYFTRGICAADLISK